MKLTKIKKGTIAESALAGKENKITGKVTQVDMAMNPYTQAFNADVIFENKRSNIETGLNSRSNINKCIRKNTIAVERKNLVKNGNKYFVYVVAEGSAK